MAVNNNFYAAINALVAQGSGSVASPVVQDYASFIDAGKSIVSIAGSDLQNNFVANLCNRIAFVVDTYRGYRGHFDELYRGNIEYGNTIAILAGQMYDAVAAGFIDLTDGQSVDQYVIHKPSVEAYYYTLSDAFAIPLTIQYDQLRKAWTSPFEMDAFIQNRIGDVINSEERKREIGRLSAVNRMIIDTLNDGEAASAIDAGGTSYNLRTLSGQQPASPTVAFASAAMSSTFITVVKSLRDAMQFATKNFNMAEIMSFSYPENLHLYISTSVAYQYEQLYFRASYQGDVATLPPYTAVPCWQDTDNPYRIQYKDAEGATQTVDNVFAVLFDENAVGEYIQSRSMDMTPYNARGKYWNNWLNVETRLINNHAANFVVFTTN